MKTVLSQAEKLIQSRMADLSVDRKMLERGVDFGHSADVKRVLSRLSSGEHITLLQLGGSITEGYFSSSPEQSQGGVVFGFLSALFPDKITFINAGIAATGAVYGAYRLPYDVLPFNPDLVIVEYNINDRASNDEAMAAFESIIRILRQKGIAVISLYNTVFSENAECAAGSRSEISKIADYYSLPTADANQAFFGEDFYKKSADEGSYFRENDGTHPTDAGHGRVGLLVCYLLYQILKNDATESRLPPPIRPESEYVSGKSKIVKAQEIEKGHPLVKITGGEYNPSPQSVGQNIILGTNPHGFQYGTRAHNTYTCYEIKQGESATMHIFDVTDAFIIIMQNKFGDPNAEFVTTADGKTVQTLSMNTYYSGALTVERSRIINCDHRVYHGEKTDITVTITARDGNVYVGGVLMT